MRSVTQVFDPAQHRADNLTEEAQGIIRDLRASTQTVRPLAVDTTGAALDDSVAAPVTGYKIQIYVSPNRDQAERAAARARLNFPSDSVYVVFQAPFHKVRVGHFRTQEEAEAKVREAESKGYRNPLWFPPSR